MQLIDIGANLTHASFESDLEQVLTEARSAHVAHIMVTGTDIASSEAAQELCARYPGYLSCTAGFHPHVASDCDATAMDTIRRLASAPELVAIGETGLDYNRNYSPKDAQLAAFEMHLQLAAATGKPLFLHQRDAHEDFIQLLRQYRSQITGGVVHCFTDNAAALSDYLAIDMHIGITGWICDERRGVELQEMVADIPADRLLIETDAPYLLPRTLSPRPKDRRNEPRHLIAVLDMLSQCTKRSSAQLAEETTANAQRLFGISLAT